MSGLDVISLFISIIVVVFFLGNLLVRQIFSGTFNEEEEIIASWGLGIVLLAIISLVLFLFNVKTSVEINNFWYFVSWFLVPVLIKRLKGLKSREFKLAIVIFFVFAFKILLIEAILPVFAGGMWTWDWRMHFDISRAFIFKQTMQPAYLLARTPIYNLVQALFLRILGDRFLFFQIVNALLSSMFVLSLYVLGKKLFNSKTALYTMVFVFFSGWFVHISWFTWPKMLAVYFLLLGLYFYLKKNLPQAGMWLAFSALTHPMALIFSLSIMASELIKKKRFWPVLKLAIPFLLLILPWYAGLAITWGIKELLLASPALAHMPEYSILNPGIKMVKSRISNGLFSVLPFYLFWGYSSPIFDWFGLVIKKSANIYWNSLWGCLTFTGSILAIASIVSAGKKRLQQKWGEAWKKIGLSVIIFTGLAVLFHSSNDKHGIFHSALTPLGPIAALFLIRLVSDKKPWLKLLFLGVVIEGLLSVWLQIWAVINTTIYSFDPNWKLKTGQHLIFLSDVLKEVEWFWLMAIVLEIGMFYWIWKRLRMTETSLTE